MALHGNDGGASPEGRGPPTAFPPRRQRHGAPLTRVLGDIVAQKTDKPVSSQETKDLVPFDCRPQGGQVANRLGDVVLVEHIDVCLQGLDGFGAVDDGLALGIIHAAAVLLQHG